MSKLQNPLIVVLGIFVSFFLFAQGEKYNLRTTAYGQILKSYYIETDTGVTVYHQDCLLNRRQEIRVRYDGSDRELQNEMVWQKIFLIIPCVILITALFVGFAVSKNEILLTVFTLTPLSLNLWGYHSDQIKVDVGPYCLIFAFILSYPIVRLKKYLFFK